MKLLLGVDVAGTYRPALNLLARLRFEAASLTLANAVDILYPVPMYGVVAEAPLGVEFAENMQQLGEEALKDAVDRACGRNLKADSVVLSGAAGPALIDLADREHFDLIAIHSVRKSALGSLFMGSVARGIAIGAHQSILISKGNPVASGSLKAVFATDHSAYCDRALEAFIGMRAKGIESIHVVSAAWMNEYDAYAAQFDLSKIEGSTEEWVESQLASKNAASVEKLRAAGYAATSKVTSGTPDIGIKEAMQDTGADLLIMGAQGHGFIHRLFIGSTSLHQVVAEDWPVLVVRPSH